METKRLCANCRFWNLPEDESWSSSAYPPHFRVCSRMAGSSGGPEVMSTLAFGLDQECYHAEVVTRDDFGCVMWESHHEPTPIVRIVNIDGDLVPYVPRP